MLKIPKNIYEALVTHAQRDFPQEACGILGGVDGVVNAHYPMANTDQSNEHFTRSRKSNSQ